MTGEGGVGGESDSPGRALLRRRYRRLVATGRVSSRPKPRNWKASELRLVVRKRRRESTLWSRTLGRVRAEVAKGQWVKVKTYASRGVARQTVVHLRRGARYAKGCKVPAGVVWEFTAVGWQVWARWVGDDANAGS